MTLEQSNPKGDILIVDDTLPNLELLFSMLTKEGYAVRGAPNGHTALLLISQQMPDLILLDVRMPDMDGYEVCRRIKSGEDTHGIPVIFISALDELGDKVEGFAVGGLDYITKPFQAEEVSARIETHLSRRRLRIELEDRNIQLKQEISERKRAETALQQVLDQQEQRIQERTAELRERESQLEHIIEASDGFIFTCDAAHRIEFMNNALIKHLGYDATGQSCHRALFKSDELCPRRLSDGLSSGKTAKVEIQDPNDGKWYYSIISPLTDSSGVILKTQVMMLDITERKKEEDALRKKEKYLRQENIRLKTSMKDRYKFGDIIGKSSAMQKIYKIIIQAAASDANVILYGESGTGKELLAETIHGMSERNKYHLVPVNCAAIPGELIEREFFGHVKGAFTGAEHSSPGYLDKADKGTLFLDEIGDIPLNMQVKLLRVIDGGGYSPLGSTMNKKPELRIIAATHKDLKQLVRTGLMREDFFYRIHIIPIKVPPLRDRKEDIPLLIDHFMRTGTYENRLPVSGKILAQLINYNWPGNVRELQNTLHRYHIVKRIDFVSDLSETDMDVTDEMINLETPTLKAMARNFEKKILLQVLERHRWQKKAVAKILGIDRRTLFNKIKYHGLEQD
ncbi:sigma 54-interacting transcriptional regulator [Desulfococcaceae bacterium HSG7]|nr:sigma 54-interacting transcriptional regulator [Desulfococcaceae bacterium HSG7]